MTKTVLVTGARGLVGGRFLREMAQHPEWRVVALSRSAPASQPEGSAAFITVDWRNAEDLARACAGADAVVHLAAMNEPDGESDPEQALLDNGLATLRLVEAAKRNGVGRFVYMSTAKVYGANFTGAVTEQTPVRPLNHYAITHHVAEDYVLAAQARGDLSGVVLRLSNGVGAPVDPSVNCWMLIANDFARQAVTERRIALSGTGIQWRNFVPLADVAQALRFALDAAPSDLGDGLFNLGGAAPMRIIDMAERVAARCEALFGHRPDVTRREPAAGESAASVDYDCSKLARAGFAPSASLDDEIDAILRMVAETA